MPSDNFQTKDGLTLYTEYALPQGEPKASILLVHGYGEHCGRYQHVIARLTSMTTMFHSQLVEHVTPFNDAMRMPDASLLGGHGLPSLAMLEGIITQQASAMAYSNDFLLMTLISLAAFPLLALIRSPKSANAAAAREAAAHAAMD